MSRDFNNQFTVNFPIVVIDGDKARSPIFFIQVFLSNLILFCTDTRNWRLNGIPIKIQTIWMKQIVVSAKFLKHMKFYQMVSSRINLRLFIDWYSHLKTNKNLNSETFKEQFDVQVCLQYTCPKCRTHTIENNVFDNNNNNKNKKTLFNFVWHKIHFSFKLFGIHFKRTQKKTVYTIYNKTFYFLCVCEYSLQHRT